MKKYLLGLLVVCSAFAADKIEMTINNGSNPHLTQSYLSYRPTVDSKLWVSTNGVDWTIAQDVVLSAGGNYRFGFKPEGTMKLFKLVPVNEKAAHR